MYVEWSSGSTYSFLVLLFFKFRKIDTVTKQIKEMFNFTVRSALQVYDVKFAEMYLR